MIKDIDGNIIKVGDTIERVTSFYSAVPRGFRTKVLKTTDERDITITNAYGNTEDRDPRLFRIIDTKITNWKERLKL